eukprot:g13254.t1
MELMRREREHYGWANRLELKPARAAALCEQNPVVCIQGPPGTGKTRTIAHISRKIVLGDVGLLVCTASSNKAVQNMLEKPRIAYIGVEDKIPDHLRQFYVHTRAEFCRTRAEFAQLRLDAPEWTRQRIGSYEEFLQLTGNSHQHQGSGSWGTMKTKKPTIRTDERLELELLMNADVVFSTLACLGRVKVLNLLRAKADGSRKICCGGGTRSSSSYDYEESGAEEVDGIAGEEEVVMGKHLQVLSENAPVDSRSISVAAGPGPGGEVGVDADDAEINEDVDAIMQMIDADSSGEETESTEPLEAGKTDRTTIEALADAISDDELREKLKRNSTLAASSVELKKRKLSATTSHVLVARKQQPPAGQGQPGTIGPKAKNHLTIIVDEAAQAVEAETLITLALQPNRLILVGDPQQLSATVIHSEECRKANYARSLMERLMKIGGSDESGGASNDNVSKAPVVMLNVQYRMHPEICSFVSNRFYAGKLETDYNLLRTRGMLGNKNFSTASSASIEVVPQHLPHLPPYLIVDHDFSEDEKVSGRGGTGNKKGGIGNNFSIRNRGEADLLLGVRKQLRSRFPEDAIRILTFYNGQRDYLAQKVVSSAWDVSSSSNRKASCASSSSPHPVNKKEHKITQEVHTVDSFQGSEAPVVLLSFTKSGKHGHGFLSEFRRLNVALSRAQHHLIVFANVKGLLSTGARPSKGRRGGVVVDEKNEEGREVELRGAPTTREDNEITALLKDAQRRGCVVSAAELERMLAGVADDPSSPAGGKKRNTKELVGTRRASSQPRGKKKSKTSASTKNKKLCVVAKMKKPEIESDQAKKTIKIDPFGTAGVGAANGGVEVDHDMVNPAAIREFLRRSAQRYELPALRVEAEGLHSCWGQAEKAVVSFSTEIEKLSTLPLLTSGIPSQSDEGGSTTITITIDTARGSESLRRLKQVNGREDVVAVDNNGDTILDTDPLFNNGEDPLFTVLGDYDWRDALKSTARSSSSDNTGPRKKRMDTPLRLAWRWDVTLPAIEGLYGVYAYDLIRAQAGLAADLLLFGADFCDFCGMLMDGVRVLDWIRTCGHEDRIPGRRCVKGVFLERLRGVRELLDARMVEVREWSLTCSAQAASFRALRATSKQSCLWVIIQ